jgi:hypothetical protein
LELLVAPAHIAAHLIVGSREQRKRKERKNYYAKQSQNPDAAKARQWLEEESNIEKAGKP